MRRASTATSRTIRACSPAGWRAATSRPHRLTATISTGGMPGAPRRFFRNRSHALHFIKSVAPTKLVDGAWLYGLLPRWSDARLAPLIRIYLEELGDGRRRAAPRPALPQAARRARLRPLARARRRAPRPGRDPALARPPCGRAAARGDRLQPGLRAAAAAPADHRLRAERARHRSVLLQPARDDRQRVDRPRPQVVAVRARLPAARRQCGATSIAAWSPGSSSTTSAWARRRRSRRSISTAS